MGRSEITIDIRQFLIIALGHNKYLYPFIDEMYQEKKLVYYNYYRESGYYNDKVMLRYSTKKIQYMQKVAGLLVWDFKNKSNINAYRLIKKGYKHVWHYMDKADHLDLEKFAQYSINRRGGAKFASDLEIFFDGVIALFIAMHNNISVSNNRDLGVSMQNILLETLTDEVYFNDETIGQNRTEIERLLSDFNIQDNSAITIENFFHLQIIDTVQKLSENRPIWNSTSEVNKESAKEGSAKYIGALSGWVKFLGINGLDITSSCVMDKKAIDKVMYEYLIAKEENNLDERDRDLFVVSCLWLKAIADEYNRTKNVYLNELQEELFYEINKVKQELESQNDILKKKEEKIEAESVSKDNEIEKLKRELQEASKKNSSLIKEIQTIQDNDKELFALREHLFTEQTKVDINISEIQFEDMLDSIKDKKVAILGGNIVWLNKIKEILPNYTVIDTDKRSLDFTFLDNLDAVFLNTSTMSHSFYEKVMARMSKNNTKMFYLSSNANIKLTIKEIHGNLTKKQ